MSDTNRPGDVPPDLPPEYAEAYLRGYERARADAPGGPGADGPATPAEELPERTAVTGPLFADEPAAVAADPSVDAEPTRMLSTIGLGEPEPTVATPFAPLAGPVGAEPPRHAGETPYDEGFERFDERERPGWLVPVLLGVAAVVLIGAAFFIGKLVASSLAGTAAADKAPDSVVMGDGSGGSTDAPARHHATGKAYRGATEAVSVGAVTATCEAPRAVDAAGRPVRYAPRNVADGDFTTAWRCDGDGIGQRLTLQIPAGTPVGQVGLVPGYAKTDPSSGADRYAENDRITKVRWVFEDGSTVTQKLDGSPRNRSLQSIRIPVTRTGQVVVEVLDSTPGPRHTIAISEVRIGRTR